MQRSLKICIFTETYYPIVGGGETQARLLADGLIANGHSAIIMTRRTDPSLQKVERINGVLVHRLSPTGSGQLKKWGLTITSIPTLLKLRKQYDLIFVSGFRIIGMSAVLISKLLGKQCILKADSQGESSGSFFDDGLKKYSLSNKWLPFKLFLKLRNNILKKANAASAISPEIADEFASIGIPPERIFLVPNSVDTTLFSPVDNVKKNELRKKLGYSLDSILIIYTGRLVSYKGLPGLVNIWPRVLQKYANAKLLLVGTGGLDIHNCEVELRNFVRENSLDENVFFTGNVENVHEYLQASDIFSFPTENDAFPSSLIEAMACALPVITTSVGAIKSFITHNQNGLIIQPGDSNQLYQAIDNLLSNKELANRLSHAACQTVQEKYSSEFIVKKMIYMFTKFLS